MYKISLELGNINEMLKLKFSIIIEVNDKNKIITKTSIDGNNFIKVNPHPFVTMDMKGKNEWDKYSYINLNKLNLYRVISTLIEVRNNLKIKELYMLDGDTPILNKSVADTLRRKVQIDIDKTLGIIYGTKDIGTETDPKIVEAVLLFINNYRFGSLLSINQLDLLIYTLKNIDMDILSMQLFQLYLNITKEDKVVNNITITKTLEELESESNEGSIPQLKKSNEIPDI